MKKEKKTIKLRIFPLVNPEYLKINNSFFSDNLIKKNWVEIKNIKGNKSIIIDGAFRKAKNIGYNPLAFESLKKVISWNKFVIKDNAKNIRVTSTKIFENEPNIYFLEVLKIIL